MKRLGVCVIYDKNQILHDCCFILFNSLRKYLDTIFCIINGNINRSGMLKLERICDRIINRENIGYDGGAYKDFFLKYSEKNDIDSYDEIILFNDSFLGPLYLWDNVFDIMDTKNIDFWSMSRYLGYESEKQIIRRPHLQAYFLSCRKKMVASEDFRQFWIALNYPTTYEDAIEDFEVSFSQYFWNKNYSSATYLDYMDHNNYVVKNQNCYVDRAYELIKDCNFPIIKRSIFRLENFIQIKKTVELVKQLDLYDSSVIEAEIANKFSNSCYGGYSLEDLIVFCREADRLFIYGNGKIGKNFLAYLKYKDISVYGIIETVKSNSEATISVDDIQLCSSDRIIISMNANNSKDVINLLNNKGFNGEICCPFV